MNRIENEIFILPKAHACILGIGFGGVEGRDPFECFFCTAAELRLGNGSGCLAAALKFCRVDICGAFRIRRRMHADAPFELLIRQFIKSGHKIELRFLGVCQKKFILTERHRAGQRHHQMRMPAFFQNLNIKLTQKRLCGGRTFEQNAVTGFYTGGMFHQNFCIILNANVCQLKTPFG